MEIKIRRATAPETERYLAFLQAVKEAMPQGEWFYLDPDEEVLEMVAAGMMHIWFAEDGDRLAAVFSIICPGLKPFNLGYDLGLSEAQLRQVIHMDTAAVDPGYRGQRLQYRMMLAAEREIASWGDRILLCTIHPDNRYSMKNVLDQGYRVQKELGKYGSVRYLLRKDIPGAIRKEEIQ